MEGDIHASFQRFVQGELLTAEVCVVRRTTRAAHLLLKWVVVTASQHSTLFKDGMQRATFDLTSGVQTSEWVTYGFDSYPTWREDGYPATLPTWDTYVQNRVSVVAQIGQVG
eukprot:5349251-Pyramimonas_sp.AAC.1